LKKTTILVWHKRSCYQHLEIYFAFDGLAQWFPNFFLSRRILEKKRNYLAHLEHLNKKFI